MKRSKSKRIRSRKEVMYCKYCGYEYCSLFMIYEVHYHEKGRYVYCEDCNYVYDLQKDKEIWDRNQISQIKAKLKREDEDRFAKEWKQQETGPLPFPDFAAAPEEIKDDEDEEGLPFNC